MLRREADWSPVNGMQWCATFVAALLLAMFFARSREDFLPVLDHVNLAFHEAGHLFFGVFGFQLGLLGGTLGQLLMPLVVAFTFWRKGETFSFAIVLVWFFENFINIARYVADARARILPLVGGGEHDWMHLLAHWNLLEQDIAIAAWLNGLAWFGIFGTVAWLGWRWMREPA